MLLQQVGHHQGHLRVGEAKGNTLVAVPQQWLLDRVLLITYYVLTPSLSTTPHLYELARGAPEHVMVELPHLLPHHPVELGRAVLALLHHGAVHQARHLVEGVLILLSSIFQIKTVVTLGTMASTWCSSTDSSSISRSTTPKCVLLSAWNTLGFSPSAPGLAASLAPALAVVP